MLTEEQRDIELCQHRRLLGIQYDVSELTNTIV